MRASPLRPRAPSECEQYEPGEERGTACHERRHGVQPRGRQPGRRCRLHFDGTDVDHADNARLAALVTRESRERGIPCPHHRAVARRQVGERQPAIRRERTEQRVESDQIPGSREQVGLNTRIFWRLHEAVGDRHAGVGGVVHQVPGIVLDCIAGENGVGQ